jgi:uncharacterized protein
MNEFSINAEWHLSKYILTARMPDDEDLFAVINLFSGTCTILRFPEVLLLSALERLDPESPVMKRFIKQGIVVNFDEQAALESMARGACAFPKTVNLTICPTMGCNFDCPYCFENHKSGKMSAEVQDDVIDLAERMLEVSGAKKLSITWFGGEPLLAPDVIESLSERLTALAEEKGVDYRASIITNGYLLDQKTVDLLDHAKVTRYQITLDGIGALHDKTRHLAGGGPTFDRIIGNLRSLKIHGHVNIRHNMHAENLPEMAELRKFVSELAEASGNDLRYYPALVRDNDAAENRGKQVGLLCGGDSAEIGILHDVDRFSHGRGHFCGANILWCTVIDAQGRLNKCWEDVDKPEHSYGSAAKWDPKDPFRTADNPDMLTVYLNTSGALDDPECRECCWLPACRGGCPNKRLFYSRECLPYKEEPQAYVLKVTEQKLKKNKK